MKLTKRQIDIICENTPEELKGRQYTEFANSLDTLGGFSPLGANWGYVARFVKVRATGQTLLIVTCFGEVM